MVQSIETKAIAGEIYCLGVIFKRPYQGPWALERDKICHLPEPKLTFYARSIEHNPPAFRRVPGVSAPLRKLNSTPIQIETSCIRQT